MNNDLKIGDTILVVNKDNSLTENLLKYIGSTAKIVEIDDIEFSLDLDTSCYFLKCELVKINDARDFEIAKLLYEKE